MISIAPTLSPGTNRFHMSAATKRTIGLLQTAGYAVDVVERWIPMPSHPGGGKRKDFLGIIDLLALSDEETLGVQSCGMAFAEHDRKILESPEAATWLRGPERALVLVGWRPLAKYRKDGTRALKDRLVPRVQYYGLTLGNVDHDGEELEHIIRVVPTASGPHAQADLFP